MFLVGGPAYSGTTLLAHLLDQGPLVCLDEPAFHVPSPRVRGYAERMLRRRFPNAALPEFPQRPIGFEAASDLIASCEGAIHPHRLGIKTCNKTFVSYAEAFARRGLPVIAIIRDIRDALASPLPDHVGGEEGLIARYATVWRHREFYTVLLRYEDFVHDPERHLPRMSAALGYELRLPDPWSAEAIPAHMIKTPRHELLRSGRISTERVGVWRRAGLRAGPKAQQTAVRMGYPP